MNLIYDVAHNIAKMEAHTVAGVNKNLCVHRKGATRAFSGGDIPKCRNCTAISVSRSSSPADMGPGVLGAGRPTGKAWKKTFGSSCPRRPAA